MYAPFLSIVLKYAVFDFALWKNKLRRECRHDKAAFRIERVHIVMKAKEAGQVTQTNYV